MRRADHPTTAERALTLALVLVAAGYAPGTAAYRDLLVPRFASTNATAVPAPLRGDAACSREARLAVRTDVELLARLPAVPFDGPLGTSTPAVTPYQSVFLAPQSPRGPPAMG